MPSGFIRIRNITGSGIMRRLHQSPSLRAAFQKQVDEKVSSKREAIHEALGDGFVGSLGELVFQLKQAKNQFKGSLGEGAVAMMLGNLPDTWVMFHSALIPTNRSGTLTEVDHLLVGPGGIFLLEVKTWKGSFSADRDNWKRREGNNWVPISNSPTSQSAYHQKMFTEWITAAVPHLPDGLVTAPVVFLDAKWVGTNHCSVPVLHGIHPLLAMIGSSPVRLTAVQVQEIASVVEDCTIPTKTTQTPKPILKSKLVKPQNLK